MAEYVLAVITRSHHGRYFRVYDPGRVSNFNTGFGAHAVAWRSNVGAEGRTAAGGDREWAAKMGFISGHQASHDFWGRHNFIIICACHP